MNEGQDNDVQQLGASMSHNFNINDGQHFGQQQTMSNAIQHQVPLVSTYMGENQENVNSEEELGHIIQAVYEYYMQQTDFSGMTADQKSIKEKSLYEDAQVEGLKQYEWILSNKEQEKAMDQMSASQIFDSAAISNNQVQNQEMITASYSQMFPQKSIFNFNNKSSEQTPGKSLAKNQQMTSRRVSGGAMQGQNNNKILIVDGSEDSLLDGYDFDDDVSQSNFQVPSQNAGSKNFVLKSFLQEGNRPSIQSSILHQPQSNGSVIGTKKLSDLNSTGKTFKAKKTIDLSSRKNKQMQYEEIKYDFQPDRMRTIIDSAVDGAIDLILNNPVRDIKRVPVRDMASKVKSKEHIYNILVTEGQYYLPPYQECTIEFLQDVLSGKKKVLQNSEVKIIKVPRFQELSAKQLQIDAYRQRKLRLYLPELGESRTINREFLFNVINSVMPEFFPENIKGALQHRKDQAAEKNNKFIEIAPQFYDLLMGSMTMNRNNRGKAIHLLGAGTKKREKKRKRDQADHDLQRNQFHIRDFDSFQRGDNNKRFKHNNYGSNEMMRDKQSQSANYTLASSTAQNNSKVT